MIKFSFSTSWNAKRAPDAASMIDEIVKMGFDRIELNFTLTSKDVCDIIDIKEKEGIEITSVHNFCPMPDGVSRSKASPDYYSLSSLDEDERRMAVKATQNTIETAGRLGASCAILHLGRVEIKDRTGELGAAVLEKASYERIRKEMFDERRKVSAKHLDATTRSVEELIKSASRNNVILGLENRYYYREIPLPEEMDRILLEFTDSHVGYWHDVGHAQIFENLGLFNHKSDYLDRFASRMVGIHFHDIKGVDDHRAPLCGEFDFSLMKPYLRKGVLMVLETQHPATAQEIRRGADYLASLYGEIL